MVVQHLRTETTRPVQLTVGDPIIFKWKYIRNELGSAIINRRSGATGLHSVERFSTSKWLWIHEPVSNLLRLHGFHWFLKNCTTVDGIIIMVVSGTYMHVVLVIIMSFTSMYEVYFFSKSFVW